MELYEIDSVYDTLELDCKAQDLIGSTTVAADGSWSFSFASLTDACGSDADPLNKLSLAVKVTLKYCDANRCFSIVDPATGSTNAAMTPWYEWHPHASSTSPKAVATNANVSLANNYFEDTATLRDAGDNRHDAALIFAGLVDVTRKLHVQASWPFFQAEDGPVYVQFPGDAATGNTSGGVTIEMLSGQLKSGWTAIHEYGHIIHQRVTADASSAWGPNDFCALDPASGLCECGTDESVAVGNAGHVLDTTTECDSWSRTGESEHKAKAWKEGFADFIAHVTLDGVTSVDAPTQFLFGCSNTTYDTNDTAAGVVLSSNVDGFGRRRIFGCDTTLGSCVDGARYPTNVARALCDWFDSTSDDDLERSGSGDTLTHTLDSMFTTMAGAYDDLGATWLEDSGFTICDFAQFHLDHEGAVLSSHEDVLENNRIGCGL